MEPSKAGHGGKRVRAGRRTEVPEKDLRKVSVMIDEQAIEMLLVVGEGNLSRGVRTAARVAFDRHQKT